MHQRHEEAWRRSVGISVCSSGGIRAGATSADERAFLHERLSIQHFRTFQRVEFFGIVPKWFLWAKCEAMESFERLGPELLLVSGQQIRLDSPATLSNNVSFHASLWSRHQRHSV